MQDLEQRVLLERKVDKLMAAKDLDVQGLAKRAREAMKRNDYTEAEVLASKATSLHRPPVKLAQLLCNAKVVSSFAEARRLVDQGVVLVDGVKPRSFSQEVFPGQQVAVKGKPVQE